MLKFTLPVLAVLTSATALAAPPQPSATVAAIKPDPHEPVPGKQDPRICTFAYDPGNTMRLTTPGLNPGRVIFSDGSVPVTTAGSLVATDQKLATDWFATSAGNTLLLQPLHADIPTLILFVTTKRGEEQSNYVIELHVGTAELTGSSCIQVSYTYPAIDAAAAAAARVKWTARQTESKIRTSLTQARFNAPRQWHYSRKGADCPTMTPSGWNWLSDDGHQTTMLLPPHMAGSSVYSRESDSTKPEDESLITPISTTTAVGTLEVLPDVYKQIVLRHGDKVCALRADHYDPIGTQPGGGSGTISPDVIRIRAPQQQGK